MFKTFELAIAFDCITFFSIYYIVILNNSIMINNTALVLEGGGFRGMFTAGILEVFLDLQVASRVRTTRFRQHPFV